MDFFLITYDIPNDRRRTKIADLLEDYGRRVQYSVFEAWLDDKMRQDMIREIKSLVQEEEDSVRLYRLCAACRGKVIVIGQGELPEPPGLVIV
ncbi:CRISPR-associated endonuclease Cas2 [Chloroflexota bacterium]